MTNEELTLARELKNILGIEENLKVRIYLKSITFAPIFGDRLGHYIVLQLDGGEMTTEMSGLGKISPLKKEGEYWNINILAKMFPIWEEVKILIEPYCEEYRKKRRMTWLP